MVVKPQRIVNIGKFIFPIGKADKATNRLYSFLGSSFVLTRDGYIATCKHILENIGDNDIALVKNYRDNKFYQLYDIRLHDSADFAVAKTDIISEEIIPPFLDEPLPTYDIMVFGYTLVGFNKKGNISLDNRVFKGNIVRVALEYENISSIGELIEISFPSLSGFSGAPVIFNYKVIGMLFDNYESEIVSYSHTEIDENGNRTQEKTSRIIELGIGHSVQTIYKCCNDLGIIPFE